MIFFLFSFLSFSKLMIFFLPKVKNIISTMKNDHKVCPFGDNDTIQLRDSVSSLLWGKKSKNSKATMRPAPAPTPAWESLSLPFWSCPGWGWGPGATRAQLGGFFLAESPEKPQCHPRLAQIGIKDWGPLHSHCPVSGQAYCGRSLERASGNWRLWTRRFLSLSFFFLYNVTFLRD